MGRAQRDKGARFEREVVTAFNEFGMEAERNLSQSRDGGYDIDSLAGPWECKVRATLPAYLQPDDGVRGVIFKQDRGETLALVRFSDLLRLLRQELDALHQPNLILAALPMTDN